METKAFDNTLEEEKVIQKLNELFGNVLHVDIIKKIAVSCHYDVQATSNKLIEISSFSDEESVIKMEEYTQINFPVTEPTYKLLEIPNSSDGESEKAKESLPSKVIPCPESRVNTQISSLSNSLKNTCFTPMSKKARDIEKATGFIHKGYKVLIIMRGLPGSGKSYLAKNLLRSTVGLDNYKRDYKLHILSTDDYFEFNGVYQFNPKKLEAAHGWNHTRAFRALNAGISPVIIDNTNKEIWEMKPYALMATDHGYIIEILEPDTHWCFNSQELAKRNSHKVPLSSIEDMIIRYQKNITPEKLLKTFSITYKPQKRPPQMRLYPPLNIDNSASTNHLNTNVTSPGNSEANDIIKSKSISFLNIRPSESKREPVETINLMDFNDEKNNHMQVSPIIEIHDDEISVTSWNQNPVDKILMCDSSNENSNILLPSSQNMADVITIDSSDDESSTPQTNKELFSDVEAAWGVNENALRSWDIVTPIRDEGTYAKLPRYSANVKITSRDSSCNTEDEYFQLLRSKRITNNGVVKILDTLNRDINRLTPERKPTVTRKYMQDKSCLTDDIFDNYDNHISQLISMFPSIPDTHLKYWYKKCSGDLEWTIEFLLDSKEDINALTEECNDDSEADVTVANGTGSDNSDSNQGETVNSKGAKMKRSRKTSDESKDIKRLIESKVEISNEHYSKHLLKVKHFKFGNNSDITDNSQASTSTVNDVQLNDASNASRSSSPESISKGDVLLTYAEKIAMIESEMEFDEFDSEDNTGPEKKPEETIELNLGANLVAQLENTFGDPNMAYPKGFQPVVQVPIEVARQLYTFYIESVYQQMETQKQVLETLISEDEEFARKLQAKEEEQANLQQVQPTPSFLEIIDEQVAQGYYQKEVDKWKNLNPDNLSARLTRQKLFSVFPSINQDTLIEILHAHNNKYQDTVETLLASTRPEDVRGTPNMIKEPPLKDDVLQEMREAQKNSTKEEYVQQEAATFYREEANKHLKKRAELFQRAQQYHQRGMTEVAQFYSGLASQQTEYFDRANNLAATAFLDEHSKRLQDFNTVDLHFLYVKEAIAALDLFLDRSINLLRLSDNKRAEYLQIITGRGKRSENGVSKIRPAAISRLKKRKIPYVQLNPGLLKVKITRNTLSTSEIKSG